MMKPLQIYMDERELQLLDVWARARGWTKSHAIRMAVRALTRIGEKDPLIKASGMIEGLPADLSERIDEYLGETFIAEKTASKYARRRNRR